MNIVYIILKIFLATKWTQEALNMAENFIQGKNLSNAMEIFSKWHSNVKLVFLNYFNENISKVTEEVYVNLRDILKICSNQYNAEVKYTWFQISLKTKHEECIENVREFLASQGRMKYIRPVYYAWFAFQQKECLEFFIQNKHVYHPVAARLIEKKLTT